MCPLFFIKFLFFHHMVPFKNYEKCFLFHLKMYFRSRDIQIFVIFSFLSTLSRFKRTNESGIIYNVMNWLARICRCNFSNNSKTALHYIIKLGQIILTNKGIFMNLFRDLKSNWWLLPGPKTGWVRKQK